MPPLNQTLRKDAPPNFVPAPLPPPALVPAAPGQTNNFKVNPWIRSPIPPTAAGPDTLRQFNDGDTNIPRRRVLPLPAASGTGSGVINYPTTIIQERGGSTTTPTLTAQTVTYTSPLLGAGSSNQQSINISTKSFQLVSVTANVACEIRMYNTALAMAVDATRAMDAPPKAELANGIIVDVVLDTAPYFWSWPWQGGANADSPQTTNLYLAVTNLSGIPQQVQLNLVMLPLESV